MKKVLLDENDLNVSNGIDSNAGLRSFSLANSDAFDEIILPPPSKPISSTNYSRAASAVSDRTPLINPQANRLRNRPGGKASKVLFGISNFNWRRTTDIQGSRHQRGISDFFFGFMYEDADNFTSDANFERLKSTGDIMNPLTVALCVVYSFTSAAAAIPVSLVPYAASAFLEQDYTTSDVSSFTSRVTVFAVLGFSFGKFATGPLVDLVGARRISCASSLSLAWSLLYFSFSQTENACLWACFFVEFCQSAAWPSVVVILASHFRGTLLEGGIYAASLAARFGSLLSFPLTAILLRHAVSWRTISAIASLWALIATWVMLSFIKDSLGGEWNAPQNPIVNSHELISKIQMNCLRANMVQSFRIMGSVVSRNIIPSVLHVLRSGTFWAVAISHAGDVMVRSSERVIGIYYFDTSGGALSGLSERKASSLAVVLSFGTILGLVTAGSFFTRMEQPLRRRLIARLYAMTIASCYALSVLAVPRIQHFVGDAALILAFQLIATFFMGFGSSIASLIPGLVGASFGRNKGLFSSYTDGVAYGLSSLVWRVVAGAVRVRSSAIVESGGWAYGWAAVALLIVMCSFIMNEFYGHFFCKSNTQGKRDYETIIFV